MPPEIQIQQHIDIEGLRVRLRGMTDEELREFGKAARHMGDHDFSLILAAFFISQFRASRTPRHLPSFHALACIASLSRPRRIA